MHIQSHPQNLSIPDSISALSSIDSVAALEGLEAFPMGIPHHLLGDFPQDVSPLLCFSCKSHLSTPCPPSVSHFSFPGEQGTTLQQSAHLSMFRLMFLLAVSYVFVTSLEGHLAL